ncbi:MAG: hypothetical protein LVQ64_00945 [Thermoplasmatales archaeon]|nr:hypothetical protein [Thermoplasmatales archaeon]
MEATEIAAMTQTEIDERAHRASEAFRRFIAQDYALITEAMLNDHLDHLPASVRVIATGETDSTDGSPVFLAVGSAPTPEATIGLMCGRPSTVRYRQVDLPAENGSRLPSGPPPLAMLPSPPVEPPTPAFSRATTAQEET